MEGFTCWLLGLVTQLAVRISFIQFTFNDKFEMFTILILFMQLSTESKTSKLYGPVEENVFLTNISIYLYPEFNIWLISYIISPSVFIANREQWASNAGIAKIGIWLHNFLFSENKAIIHIFYF